MPRYIERSRHGLYYLRLPKHLAHLNEGKRVSLHTHSKRLAIQRASRHISSLNLCLSLTVTDTVPTSTAEYQALKEELERDFQKENRQLDQVLLAAARLPDSSTAVKVALEQRLRNVLVEETMHYIAQQLENAALTPGGTPENQYAILHGLLNHAENLELEVTGMRQPDGSISRSTLEQAKGIFRAEVYSQHEELAERSAGAQAPATLTSKSNTAPTPSGPPITLVQLHALQQIDAQELEGPITSRTQDEYERFARVLTVLSERKDIRTFTQEDFERLHKVVQKIKLGAVRRLDIDTTKVSDLIPSGTSYTAIQPETASTYSVRLNALHLFAYKKGYTSVHPDKIAKPRFAKIANKQKKATSLDDTKAKSYRVDELQTIFNGYLYRPAELSARKEIHVYQFWLPLIAVYSGMRIDEICGLSTRAIEQSTNGIWHFKVEEQSALQRKLKTKASKRRVPVHRHLIELGFIDYVQERRQQKAAMLFDGLHHNRNGWGNTATRFFTRLPTDKSVGTGYLFDIGVHKQKLDGRDFHAFRHTFIDRLRACGVDSGYDIEAITGHEKEDVSEADRYGDGPELRDKAEKVNRVSYDFDLSHIDFKLFKNHYRAALTRSLRAFKKERQKKKNNA
ncbi:site-specific integrase [Pseudomonas aeruginosa]|uniref:site-specific integrase n=1 Tax=Pseudomonas aeruginosa TaxID=287 RepID=UPI000FF71E51|nr:site-specific integrase [Pseudomonas aeruginosa]MBA5079721.1 site-specific integrase [Pseudomonas aeruginosa]MCO3636954.1 site-specific integrase [Pseudomonas aeruginosa]MDI2267350.1 site-specific integrase [Pseudomonas aeruginosa]MDI2279005.1 site-specific integrase [Pseudomonas aeruginosa]MDI2291541.1 site-specific integrase [Pseudomonas aeruginosa]